ncbi:UDP-glycosyltransferase 73E1-like [Salvia miltiorrhiza]|uniref:UDP-glycosyltransferase 73E1-like n=1 Tax=Salvia miltiorrhiza TaxID=226208 RepID=UPI0025AB8304|nr:UDP-glycosyltransferase 73E1-like [Salvia miltiorrhiza]
MASESQPPNFVLLPLMSPGHIIPMIHLAKLVAKRGVHVSIVVTHLDASRFSSRIAASGHPIRLLKVRFPCDEAGLPPGCESADLLPSFTLLPNFFTAINLLEKPVEAMLQRLSPPPTCILSDKYIIWTVQTCDALKIPRLVFDGMSCFTQLVTHHLYTSKIYQTPDPTQLFSVPNFPDKIEFSRSQLPGLFNPGTTDVKGYRERVREAEVLAYGMVVNTFHELEHRYVDEFRKLGRGRIWCIGPLSLSLSLCNEEDHDDAVSDHDCLKWLDDKKPGSVVYACLGSLSRISAAQFAELALGLEESGREFLLVVKVNPEVERWIGGDGIEERVKGRGFLLRGWAPQVAILGHPAVGAFLTHCGWNSTLEGISAGVPMVTWPIFAEQFLNEKLVVEVHETGVSVGARRVVHLGEEEKAEDMVRRERIRKAVERVMDEREEGSERRKRARELGERARRSVKEGGSSYQNITTLIQDIADFINKN